MSAEGDPGEDPIPLARREDFRLGRALVRPSIRTIQTPAAQATAEPRVMQVILALVDARGGVLSRDDLLRICWGGRIVGDDAINRAVAEARRLSQVTGAGYQIETIPRIGYRLVVDEAVDAVEIDPAIRPAATSRRKALGLAGGGLAIGALALAGLGSWRRSSEADELVRQGKLLQQTGGGDAGYVMSADYFRRALRLEPDRAEAWGLLSLALGASATDLSDARNPGVLGAAQTAAQKALSIDPREPNARAGLALVRRGLDDWIVFESELRSVLHDDPDNYFALSSLVWFFQGIGRFTESWQLNERALAIAPLSPTCMFRRGMKHWIAGRTADADRVSVRALELWPMNPNVWNSRLTILAFTGRPTAALRMLEDAATRPPMGKTAVDVWRSGLVALESGSPADIDRTRSIALGSFTQAPGIAANAVMLLSALKDVDAAYQVAEGVLLRRGVQPQRKGDEKNSSFYRDAGWRGTQWLFTPATKALRDDPRFTAFCEALGFSEYWRKRGIWPDSFLRGSLRTV